MWENVKKKIYESFPFLLRNKSVNVFKRVFAWILSFMVYVTIVLFALVLYDINNKLFDIIRFYVFFSTTLGIKHGMKMK